MFATMLGTNRETEAHTNLCERLCQFAVAQGFVPPDTTLTVQPDQTPLDGWIIEQLGPANAKADFLLAVTAPKIPGLSPIPAMNTVAGPVFSVVVMQGFFGVWQDNGHRYVEFKEDGQVMEAFESFLHSLEPTSAMPRDEFSYYLDGLFIVYGRIDCSKCGLEFPPIARPARRDATCPASLAAGAIERGWRRAVGNEVQLLCPQCARGATT